MSSMLLTIIRMILTFLMGAGAYEVSGYAGATGNEVPLGGFGNIDLSMLISAGAMIFTFLGSTNKRLAWIGELLTKLARQNDEDFDPKDPSNLQTLLKMVFDLLIKSNAPREDLEAIKKVAENSENTGFSIPEDYDEK